MKKFKPVIKKLLNKKGFGTTEAVIIIAVLVGIALIFRDSIISFSSDIMDGVFGDNEIRDELSSARIREDADINE